MDISIRRNIRYFDARLMVGAEALRTLQIPEGWRYSSMARFLIHPLPHLPHLRYCFICLFYTIPMPDIYFCRRETEYLRFPVFLERLSPLVMPAASAGADFEHKKTPM